MLDLPRLLYLNLESLKSFEIVHPKSLRILSISNLSVGNVDYSQFTGLTKIYAGTRNSISASFFDRIPSLQELHLNDVCGLYKTDYDFNGTKELPAPFLNQAKPRIFYYDIELTVNQLNNQTHLLGNQSQRESCRELTKFVIKNLHQTVGKIEHVTCLDYNTLAEELDDTEIFVTLFQKVLNLNSLYIGGNVADKNRLLKFVLKFRPQHLRFERALLPQSFFQKLSQTGSFIQLLMFRPRHTTKNLTKDFDFILGLRGLQFLIFPRCPPSLNFVVRLLKGLKSLSMVQFCHRPNTRFILGLNELSLVSVEFQLSFFEIEEDRLKFMEALRKPLKADEEQFVCIKKVQILVRHLSIEKQNHLFMMRKEIYDQTHFYMICFSKEQMRRFEFC